MGSGVSSEHMAIQNRVQGSQFSIYDWSDILGKHNQQ
jgi:hypothetical protein